MEQRIDFERNIVSWNAKSRSQMMKFHRGQKWLSSRSTDLEISLLPCISLLSDGEPIELDRLLDREGGSSPKLGMSLPPSRPCKLGQLSSFSSLSPLIEFHDISTNFPGVYRGICEAKIVETVWKWPSISPLATRNIVTGGKGDENFVARKFEYVHVVHLLFPRKDRFGNSLNCFGLLCIYFRIL